MLFFVFFLLLRYSSSVFQFINIFDKKYENYLKQIENDVFHILDGNASKDIYSIQDIVNSTIYFDSFGRERLDTWIVTRSHEFYNITHLEHFQYEIKDNTLIILNDKDYNNIWNSWLSENEAIEKFDLINLFEDFLCKTYKNCENFVLNSIITKNPNRGCWMANAKMPIYGKIKYSLIGCFLTKINTNLTYHLSFYSKMNENNDSIEKIYFFYLMNYLSYEQIVYSFNDNFFSIDEEKTIYADQKIQNLFQEKIIKKPNDYKPYRLWIKKEEINIFDEKYEKYLKKIEDNVSDFSNKTNNNLYSIQDIVNSTVYFDYFDKEKLDIWVVVRSHKFRNTTNLNHFQYEINDKKNLDIFNTDLKNISNTQFLHSKLSKNFDLSKFFDEILCKMAKKGKKFVSNLIFTKESCWINIKFTPYEKSKYSLTSCFFTEISTGLTHHISLYSKMNDEEDLIEKHLMLYFMNYSNYEQIVYAFDNENFIIDEKKTIYADKRLQILFEDEIIKKPKDYEPYKSKNFSLLMKKEELNIFDQTHEKYLKQLENDVSNILDNEKIENVYSVQDIVNSAIYFDSIGIKKLEILVVVRSHKFYNTTHLKHFQYQIKDDNNTLFISENADSNNIFNSWLSENELTEKFNLLNLFQDFLCKTGNKCKNFTFNPMNIEEKNKICQITIAKVSIYEKSRYSLISCFLTEINNNFTYHISLYSKMNDTEDLIDKYLTIYLMNYSNYEQLTYFFNDKVFVFDEKKTIYADEKLQTLFNDKKIQKPNNYKPYKSKKINFQTKEMLICLAILVLVFILVVCYKIYKKNSKKKNMLINLI
jgi:hypothetical protein